MIGYRVALAPMGHAFESVLIRVIESAHDLSLTLRDADIRTAAHQADLVIIDGDAEGAIDQVRLARSLGLRAVVATRLNEPRSVVTFMAAGADACLGTRGRSRDIAAQVRLAASRATLIAERD
ncbi:hypothetical protein QT381_13040 [Galbitalea sp. SE-J8]|uniref:hypothetical protein n=1 Tax=Galbitalea sp. SE-J8 TaxID=3054952 RepID=UPI00259D15C0|nr:hypothetical protein [Galbitalea sp. SE-J8]MDM4763933.1 hypothetical protein [Galbitalea sp. SE-J8]